MNSVCKAGLFALLNKKKDQKDSNFDLSQGNSFLDLL